MQQKNDDKRRDGKSLPSLSIKHVMPGIRLASENVEYPVSIISFFSDQFH
jgi:hypothetical protein